MTVPVPNIEDRDGGALGAAVAALWELTHVLRRECPWDLVQTPGSIVPHTLEEAWEVADAARAAEAAVAELGAEADLSDFEDELGDLLFQVCFLAMWCGEQRPEIDLGSVAGRIFAKLVRRHPHVFGEQRAATDEISTPDAVLAQWNRIKREGEQRGLFTGIPQAMPPLARARKVAGRAASIGFDFEQTDDALRKLEEEVAELRAALAAARATDGRNDHVEQEIGDVLFACANVARRARVEPEIALRDTTARFQQRVETAIALASAQGVEFEQLDLDSQEHWYQQAKRQLDV